MSLMVTTHKVDVLQVPNFLGQQCSDSLMAGPQVKRLKQQENFGKESPFQQADIFIPSEIDKLKKLFPLVDTKVSTNKHTIMMIATRGSLQRVRPQLRQGLREDCAGEALKQQLFTRQCQHCKETSHLSSPRILQ